MLKIIGALAIFILASNAFSYETFSTYCIDCSQGQNIGSCTPEIKTTVDAIIDEVNAPYSANQSQCFMTNIVVRNITELDLRRRQISDVSPLSGLKKLEKLTLLGNEIEELDPLSGLQNLKELNLEINRIADIRPLTGLRKIEILSLGFNDYIADLKPLKNLLLLRELYVQWNQISDLNPISSLINLEVLFVHENQIQDFSVLSKLPKLKHTCT